MTKVKSRLKNSRGMLIHLGVVNPSLPPCCLAQWPLSVGVVFDAFLLTV